MNTYGVDATEQEIWDWKIKVLAQIVDAFANDKVESVDMSNIFLSVDWCHQGKPIYQDITVRVRV